MYSPQSAQSLVPEAIHPPDSVAPDEGSCTLQPIDLDAPGLDLLPAWVSGLPVSDAQSPVLAQGLDAWVQFEHPDDLSILDSAHALLASAGAEYNLPAPERSMSARPGELSTQAQAMLQRDQQDMSSMSPADQREQHNDFSHRALRFGLLESGLE